MPSVDEEVKRLTRDIERLLETNCQDWRELSEKSISNTARLSIRKTIADRDVELGRLVERKWILLEGR